LALLQRFKTPFVEPPPEEPVRFRARSRSIGEILRDRREELDLDLETIGATLRIKPAYLVALEQDRSHELPGAAYAMGFIKAYSRHLGLDEEAVLSRLKDESAGFTARQDLSLPVPLGERSLPGAAMLLIALILGLCGYGTWYYLSTGERNRPERVTSVPQALQPPTKPGSPGDITLASGLSRPPANGGASAEPAPPPTAPASSSAVSPSPAPTPAQAQTEPHSPQPDTPPASAPQFSVPPAAKPDPSTKVAAAGTSPPATGAVPAAAAGDASRVSIKAVSDCWIQVHGSDDSIVFSRVLKAGETYKVPAKSGLVLRTGNAGALQVSVDGKAAPSIGGVGAMRRNVALDPAELAAGTAVHG
jgi:cytoskeleton protein RodZ